MVFLEHTNMISVTYISDIRKISLRVLVVLGYDAKDCNATKNIFSDLKGDLIQYYQSRHGIEKSRFDSHRWNFPYSVISSSV